MSHYTNQNPISEQAWMNSVLGQMGRSESSKCNESNQEVSELVDSINKLSNILSSNNNNLPTDPIAMEEFVEKLDVLGDLIGNLMEAEEGEEEPSKSKKVFISKPTGKVTKLPHTPVVSKQISLRIPSAAKIVLSVIQKLMKIRSKPTKETTTEEQEFLNAYKSAFPREPKFPLGPDTFRSFVKIKKSFPNLFES